MAEVEISYNGQNIVELNASGEKTLRTGGKYNARDIEVKYTKSAPSGRKTISDLLVNDVSSYAEAQVMDANLIAGNIKKDVSVLGILGTLESGGAASGSITPASQTNSLTITVGEGKTNFLIYSTLGYTTVKKSLVVIGIKGKLAFSSSSNNTGTSSGYPVYAVDRNVSAQGYGVQFNNNGTVTALANAVFDCEEYKWFAW